MWDPYEKGDVATLEKVQRRAARFVKGDCKRIQCHANDMLSRMAEPRSAQGCQPPIPDVQDCPRPCGR